MTAGLQTEELYKQLLISLRKIIRSIDQHSRNLIKSFGLTIPQLLILQETAVTGESTVSRLAKAVNLSQPTVTDIVDRLLERGFLKRTPSGEDRRSHIIAITESGSTLLEQNPSLFQQPFLDSYDRLQEWEKTQILSTIQRLAGLMNEE